VPKLNFNYLSTHQRNKKKVRCEVQGEGRFGAIKESETINKLAVENEVSPVMISRWKKEFIENSASTFKAPKIEDSDIEKEKEKYLRVNGDL
jgi:hypothetical protein